MQPHSPRRPSPTAALVLVTALLALAAAAPLQAQSPDPETAARVLLDTAREFEREGRTDVASALYAWILERYGRTAAAEGARQRMAQVAATPAQRSGRVELQVWGTTYGIWLGAAVPAALGADSPEAYGAGLLLGAPAGLLLSRAVVRSRPITDGQARAITWGGTWGTWQGYGWAEVFDVGLREECVEGFCYTTGERTEEIFASMILGGLAGAATGAWIARNPVSSGVASGAHYGSLWGSWVGLATALMVETQDDAVFTTTLLAGNAGLLAGALTARRFGLTRDRLRLITVGGLVGLLGGFGLDLMVQPESDAVIFGLPLVLSGAGLGVAAHLTRDSGAATPSREAFDVDGGGLLSYETGSWSVQVPRPHPVLVTRPDASGRDRWRPALAFSLFSGSF